MADEVEIKYLNSASGFFSFYFFRSIFIMAAYGSSRLFNLLYTLVVYVTSAGLHYQSLNTFMKPVFLLLLLCCGGSLYTSAQHVDSIYFHLYTDSLKKVVYNYINVDGKLSNGRWLPLTDKEIQFSSSGGKWDGNNLILDAGYNKDSVVVTAVLRSNKQLLKNITIYIKRKPDDAHLKTEAEIMNEINSGRKKGRKG